MKTKTAVTPPAANLASNGTAKRLLMMALPVIVAVLLLFVPVPEGLPPYAWHYFAIFVGVIVGLIFEPLPGAVIGLTGVVAIALCSQWVLFSPEQLADPKFKLAGVDSIGQRNSHVKTCSCGGLLNETDIYSKGKNICF